MPADRPDAREVSQPRPNVARKSASQVAVAVLSRIFEIADARARVFTVWAAWLPSTLATLDDG
jgi:hypothetical protein